MSHIPARQFHAACLFRPRARGWALTILLFASVPIHAQPRETTVKDLDAILSPAVTIQANGNVEIRFTNIGSQEITGFHFSRVDTYDDGTQHISRMAGGADFVGFIAESEVLGIPPSGYRLRPGDSYTFPSPQGGALDHKLTGVAISVTSLIFADRTAMGDPKEIKALFSGRRQDLLRIESALTEARVIMASTDPRAALSTRLSTIKGGNRADAPGAGFLELLSAQLNHGDKSQVDKMLAAWEARRRALTEHSVRKEGGQ